MKAARLLFLLLLLTLPALAAPSLGYIFPFGSNTSGGNPAVAYGTGFVAGATISVGGNTATGTVSAGGTQFSFTVPAKATAGAWQSATITNPDTTNSTITLGIYYDNVQGCGANCGNVGYSYSGPAQTNISACNTALAAGNYLLTQNVSAADAATQCFGLSFPSAAVTIDLGGHTVTGKVGLSANNNIGNAVMNGTISCTSTGPTDPCIDLNKTSDTAHHLTLNVSSAAPASCTGMTGITWEGTEATSSPLLQTHLYNLLINMNECDIANRTQAVRDSGSNGASVRSVSLEMYNVKIVWANSVSASQGLEAFAGAGVFVHNSEFVLPSTCVPCTESSRAVIFDSTFPGEFSFSKATVIGNRGVRVRGTQNVGNGRPLYSANAIPVSVSTHDNFFGQIATPGREGAITVGENDNNIDDVVEDIFSNTFELSTGFGVSVSAATNTTIHNNTVTCYLADCSTVGFLVQAQVPSLLYGATGTIATVTNNNVSVLTAAGKPTAKACGSPSPPGNALYTCAASSGATLTTEIDMCNSGTAVGNGTIVAIGCSASSGGHIINSRPGGGSTKN